MSISVTALTAAQILAIPEHAPEKLFSGELAKAQSEYRTLGRRWHPDCNREPDAMRVFQHVSRLYKNACVLIETNDWRGRGELMLIKSGALARSVSFLKTQPFELGEVYVGKTEIVYCVKREFADLFENAKRQIANYKFADARMKREVAKLLPPEPEFYATEDRLIMLLAKKEDLVQLEDLLIFSGGALDARHAAWIQSCLHNLACYLEYARIAHQDISPFNFFVSPQFHTGALLGGWWYARGFGQTLKALPERTVRCAPPDVIRRKLADGRVDLELVKATGREMLGDAKGLNLRSSKEVPAAFARWVCGATSGEAVTDYKLWKYALEMSFGAKKFIEMNVTADDLY